MNIFLILDNKELNYRKPDSDKSLFFFVRTRCCICSVSVIPLQHRSCSVCMSFVRLGHHNR